MPRSCPPHPCAGQAALEYVALLALLALVAAAGAAALAPPDLAGSVVRTLRLALCRVSGGVCTTADAGAEHLEPCLLRALADEEATSVTVGFVRVGRDDALEVEKKSDGSATV